MNRTRPEAYRSVAWCVSAVLFAFPGEAAYANINLEWRPVAQIVGPGSTVNLKLYAVSDSEENQELTMVEVIFTWEPTYLDLTGLDHAGAAPRLISGFLTTGECRDWLNESVPPQDGDGLYTWFGPLGGGVYATPAGTLLTTFKFHAEVGTMTATDVVMLASIGTDPECHSMVTSGDNPNALGELGSAEVLVGCVNDADCEPGAVCDEGAGVCRMDCTGQPDGTPCPDGFFCSGEETCQSDICTVGVEPCDQLHCQEGDDVCLECLNDGECAANETCEMGSHTCMVDCNGNDVPDAWEVSADFDGDGTVDLDDYHRFSECLTEPCGGPFCDPPLYADVCCVIADSDLSGAVDLRDFAAFTLIFTSPP